MKNRLFSGVIVLAALVIPLSAAAQAPMPWPTKPITVFVPYAAGSTTDSFSRLVIGEVAKNLHATIVVENLNGAGGVIATDRVVHAAADGYTFLIGVESTILLAQLVKPSTVKYDGLKDLKPIALMASAPLAIVARNDLPVNTMQDLMNTVKVNAGAFSYGTSGIGTSLHLAGEMLNQETHAQLTHIPYSVSTQIMTDVAGGHLDIAIMPLGTVVPFVKSGKVKALAVTADSRFPSLPDVPATGEIRGLRNVNMIVWYGLFAPAKLDDSIAARMGREVKAALDTDAVRQRAAEMSMLITPAAGESFDTFLSVENRKFKSIVSERHIKAE